MTRAATNEQALGTATIRRSRERGAAVRLVIIGLISFLTLVDLFAAQAILPSLVRAYHTTPAMMGFAVNASTIGMAIAGVVVALISRYLNRRRGIWMSLAMLAVPTTLLATAPDITSFMLLRVAQGLCMSTAFTLTMAYLAEQSSAQATASALAAYITGNVASNLVGRLISATISDNLGLATNFYFFAMLNLAGALLVYFTIKRVQPMRSIGLAQSPLSAMTAHWRDPALRAAFGLGFCILFAFVGTFTYVNFVLVRAPLSLGMMGVGFVYFVFLPSLVTTLLASKAVNMFGMRPALWGGLAVAALGLPLMLSSHLADVLAGMVLVGVGTFFAQACATSFVAQAAQINPGVASGTYLACYFFGGLAGSAVLGQLFDHFGWLACVAGVATALALGCVLTIGLRLH